jgi:LAO/AO transport system kinase
MLQLAHPAAWTPPVIRTVAPQMRGLSELWDAIQAHRVFLETSGEWAVRERQRLRTELDWLIRTALVERFHAALPSDLYPSTLDALLARRLSPYQAAQNLIAGDAHDLL